jgi:hypothetical protein
VKKDVRGGLGKSPFYALDAVFWRHGNPESSPASRKKAMMGEIYRKGRRTGRRFVIVMSPVGAINRAQEP